MALRLFRATSSKSVHVALIGAAGGIGQPLGLLLKGNKAVTKLTLFDIAHTPGVAKDLSHISTPAQVEGYTGADLGKAVEGADIIIVPAGVPRKPGMTRDDLFNMNASVVYGVAEAVAKHAPKAKVCIITNPVNSTVPIFAEVLKKHGKFDPTKLFGVTSLDLVRARTFVAESKNVDMDVPVVGGHSGPTIVPLLSQVKGATFTAEELEKTTHRIQYAGDEVVNAKAGAGSATLSMAYAGYRFADALIRAAAGETVSEWAFVQTNVEPQVDFFATKVQLGKEGVTNVEKVPALSQFEQGKYAECVEQLKKDIAKGVQWAQAK